MARREYKSSVVVNAAIGAIDFDRALKMKEDIEQLDTTHAKVIHVNGIALLPQYASLVVEYCELQMGVLEHPIHNYTVADKGSC